MIGPGKLSGTGWQERRKLQYWGLDGSRDRLPGWLFCQASFQHRYLYFFWCEHQSRNAACWRWHRIYFDLVSVWQELYWFSPPAVVSAACEIGAKKKRGNKMGNIKTNKPEKKQKSATSPTVLSKRWTPQTNKANLQAINLSTQNSTRLRSSIAGQGHNLCICNL